MAFSSRETQLLELKDMLSQLNKTISQQAETIACAIVCMPRRDNKPTYMLCGARRPGMWVY